MGLNWCRQAFSGTLETHPFSYASDFSTVPEKLAIMPQGLTLTQAQFKGKNQLFSKYLAGQGALELGSKDSIFQ